MKILVVDVGGTNIKVLATDQSEPRKIPSGPTMTAETMARDVLNATKDWQYEVVSIGYPGPVINGKPRLEPKNLAPGWVDFDYEKGFGRPVRVINDAAMQALGSYEGGRMLFLGLGTGLGSALIIDNVIAPLELAHLPYKKKKTFEDYVGERGLVAFGKKDWKEAVFDVIQRLKAALIADYVVVGGGNVKKLEDLPEGVRRGDNFNAFLGGFRLWER